MYNKVKRQAIESEELEYWIMTISVGLIGAVIMTLLILKFIS